MARRIARRHVLRLGGETASRREDALAVEEPLEIRVGGRALSVTMRTPGEDFDLVAGFLATEGVIRRSDDLATMLHCASDGEENTYNVIDVTLAPGVTPPDASLERNFYTTSSCGVCGKASIDAVRTVSPYDVGADALCVDRAVLAGLPEAMRGAQQVFERTGGLHAAALFEPDGRLLCLREDVGRHNAVDKVVGWAVRQGRLPLRGLVLQVSGRASFELAQKAVMAGVPVLAAVSAPSSLAVDLAAQSGLTLVGFSRGTSLNVYAHPSRVAA
ncbi:MAG: formate dehydrogenase accessory sulfurtransferase FdhD [Actinomycetota bacterium]|nr:formate dehydrogenase accessory sulfurtransferase FdhD [Actinomycetota bacterium]